MKKIVILVAMLALVTPAMAATNVTIDACSIGTTGVAAIVYNATGGDVSGFGLNITVDGGKTIIAPIGGYHVGESLPGNKGYGIFPGTIDINDTTGNVDSYGNPVAPSTDPCALGGLGTSGITIELGALYTTGNAPNRAGTLCTVTVSGTCNLTLALNQRRGGVVDVNYLDANVTLKGPRLITKVTTCTVPNVVNVAEATATAAITAAGFTLGTRTTARHDTIIAGNVISTNPAAGVQTCGIPVAYLVSLGPCTVPNVVNQLEATATAAITAAGFTLGTRTTAKDDAIVAGYVISTNPAAGVQPCGNAVAYVVSLGPCIVPNIVGMSKAAADAAITAAGFVSGGGTGVLSCVTLNQVLTQNPGSSQQTCGSTVNYTYSLYQTTMPNILGMTQADANAAIIAAGLVIYDSNITWGTSSTVDINTVMHQDPNGGDVLSCDPHSPKYKLSSGCYPHGKGDYNTWRVVASPNFKTHSWCYARQCYGDTDDATGGTSKSGYYYVGSADLGVLLGNWQILDPPFGPGTPAAGIAADFAHDLGGTSKSGYYRVGSTDLGILLSNWQILEPPFGPGMKADCQNVP